MHLAVAMSSDPCPLSAVFDLANYFIFFAGVSIVDIYIFLKTKNKNTIGRVLLSGTQKASVGGSFGEVSTQLVGFQETHGGNHPS